MLRRPPGSTRTDTLFPYPTLFRSSAAQPECVETLATGLAGVQRGDLQITDAPGERLARLFEQVDRSRTEHQKAAGATPAPPSGVDQPAQGLEELRGALNLVEDDQLVRVLRSEEHTSELQSLMPR